MYVKQSSFLITRCLLLQYPASLRQDTYWLGFLFPSSLNQELFRSTARSNGLWSIYVRYLYPKVIWGDTMQNYCTEDVCPAGYSAAVACSTESCINLKCITTPVWHPGIFPDFVDLELRWLVPTKVPFLSVTPPSRSGLKSSPLPSSVICCSLSPKCTSHRHIFYIWDWGTSNYSSFNNNMNPHIY